jgi:Sugar-transfer associated ATP-grasp
VFAGGSLVARARRWASRELIHRRLPHGLIHWSYLYGSPTGPLARQREMWRGSVPRLPRPLWAVLEAWLWLRWQLWSGPASVARAVRRAGPRVREEEGLGLLEQARAVASIALGFCVPPFEIYRHRLYRPENRHRVSELVFDHTADALRRLLDAPGPATQDSLRLLEDKERQTAELSAMGVPMAPIIEVVQRGASRPLSDYVSDGRVLFCKPRHGSASVGAFSTRLLSVGPTVQPLQDRPLSGQDAESYWKALLRDDDMLIQPRLSVTPVLACAATDDDIVTSRYITRRAWPGEGDAEEIVPFCATLELPASRDDRSGWALYVVLQVEVDTGQVGPFPQQYLRAEAAERHSAALGQLSGLRLPDWAAICRWSAVAHRHCEGVHSIAWDWAFTASGPLLLEGNAGWAVGVPQQLKGGLCSWASLA